MRDVRFGRLYLPTIFDDISESVGGTLETIGGGVVPGERRARTMTFSLPLHGVQGDDLDPYSEGFKMRRALRSLMENPAARNQGIYFRFGVDEELNSWIVASGGDLKYENGGVTLGEFRFSFQEAYRVAARRTHRQARRLQILDTRLSTTPRDYLGTIFLTDFVTNSSPWPLVYLPVGATDITGYRGRLLNYTSFASAGGDLRVAYIGFVNGEVLSFEQPELAMHGLDDVVVYDRRGMPSVNLVSNPGAEIDTSGWSAAAGVTLTRTTGQFRSGVASFNAAFTAIDQWVASPGINFVAGKKYTATMWVRGSAGQKVSAYINGSVAPGRVANVPASGSDVSLAGTWWHKLTFTFISGVTATQNLGINSRSAGAQTLQIDDVSVVEGGQENLVLNPSGERDAGGWNTLNVTSIAQSFDQARTGRRSLKVIANGTTPTAISIDATIGGNTSSGVVNAEAWVWSPVARTFTFMLGELGGASGNIYNANTSVTVPARIWTRLADRRTITANDRTSMNFYFETPGLASGDFFYVDAGRIYLGNSSAEEPFDDNILDPSRFGWEEVYGKDFPLTSGEVPVICNGLCRLSWYGTGFALETYINNSYHEIGRITVLYAGAQVPFASAHVEEWTPERAVIKVVLSAANRAILYITLLRGWSAPRIEYYSYQAASDMEIRFVPSSNTTTGTAYAGFNGVSTYAFQQLQSAGTWGTLNYAAWTAGTLPFAALSGPTRTVGMIVAKFANRLQTRDDTLAYGSLRKAVGIVAATPGSINGYVSVRFAVQAAGAPYSDNLFGIVDVANDSYYNTIWSPDFVAR